MPTTNLISAASLVATGGALAALALLPTRERRAEIRSARYLARADKALRARKDAS